MQRAGCGKYSNVNISSMHEHQEFDIPEYQAASKLYSKALVDERHEAAYLTAVKQAKKLGDAKVVAAAWYYLANFLGDEQEYSRALEAYLNLLRTEIELYGPQAGEVGGSWANFSHFMGRYDPAIAECAKRIEIAIRQGSASADSHKNTPTTEFPEGNEAVEQLIIMLWGSKALDRVFCWAAKLPSMSAINLASSLRCIGHSYEAAGRFEEAAVAYHKCLEHMDPTDEFYLDTIVSQAELQIATRPQSLKLPVLTLQRIRTHLQSSRDRPGSDEDKSIESAQDLLALAGDVDDVPTILSDPATGDGLRHRFYDLRKSINTLVNRGNSIQDLHRTMVDIVNQSPTRSLNLSATYRQKTLCSGLSAPAPSLKVPIHKSQS
jgi:tetratricopeptide (TPR) repeat protein